jgi:hypothetical protein
MEKTLNVTSQPDAKAKVSDVQFWGDDVFLLISKASSDSQGWMKSTKAMQTERGCVVQVSTQQRNPDGTNAVAEAVTFVPDVEIYESRQDGKVVNRWLGPVQRRARALRPMPEQDDPGSGSSGPVYS